MKPSRTTAPAAAPVRAKGCWWWKTLVGGTLLWLVTAGVTLATQNTNLPIHTPGGVPASVKYLVNADACGALPSPVTTDRSR
ncbi:MULTISPECIES: hypothetical protein [unclassified Isoptericola]|uniref:hypothetical protein n=1 Tax=unclassified Isoptericola TaxID=2623355 RepID=UPI003655CF25